MFLCRGFGIQCGCLSKYGHMNQKSYSCGTVDMENWLRTYLYSFLPYINANIYLLLEHLLACGRCAARSERIQSVFRAIMEVLLSLEQDLLASVPTIIPSLRLPFEAYARTWAIAASLNLRFLAETSTGASCPELK